MQFRIVLTNQDNIILCPISGKIKGRFVHVCLTFNAYLHNALEHFHVAKSLARTQLIVVQVSVYFSA